MDNNSIKIQKYISMAGIASRRKAEELILQGRVTMDGVKVELGERCVIGKNEIAINGELVLLNNKKLYLMLNKPYGFVTTTIDPFGRDTVIDIIKKDIPSRVFPVGRLDYESEGLLLLTNDGAFANMLAHPKFKIPKTYVAVVKGGNITKEELGSLRNGVKLEDGMTLPAKVYVGSTLADKTTELKITIFEGRNRQVRRMCDAVGHPVKYLQRVSIGDISLGHLPLGKWRHLKDAEVERLISSYN